MGEDNQLILQDPPDVSVIFYKVCKPRQLLIMALIFSHSCKGVSKIGEFLKQNYCFLLSPKVLSFTMVINHEVSPRKGSACHQNHTKFRIGFVRKICDPKIHWLLIIFPYFPQNNMPFGISRHPPFSDLQSIPQHQQELHGSRPSSEGRDLRQAVIRVTGRKKTHFSVVF